MTMEDIKVRAAGDVDHASLYRTSEADIRRHAAEDGDVEQQADQPGRVVIPPALVRAKTGLSQEEFARALGIPVGMLRDWEKGRKRPDPAANSLFVLINADPERMLGLLQPAEM